jgi:thioredoxin-like negative regulator of GroEL
MIKIKECPPAGQPMIILFGTVACNACKTAQARLTRWSEEGKLGATILYYVDLSEHPEMGVEFQIMSVPTTVVMTPDRRVVGTFTQLPKLSALQALRG